DIELTARHIDVAAHVSVDARTTRADLQILPYAAVDRDVTTADRKSALHFCIGSDIHVTAGNAGAAVDFPVESHVTTRAVQATVDVRSEVELAAARPLTPPHDARRGDPGPGEDGIPGRAVAYPDIRACHEHVVAESARGGFVFAGTDCLRCEAPTQARDERQRDSGTRRLCHWPSSNLLPRVVRA